MKVSIMLLTIDRFDITKSTFEKNILRASCPGAELEILVADNGSSDRRIIEYFEDMKIHYHRKNLKNEGVARAFNQLYLRATGNFICFLGNDIEMPNGWLEESVKLLNRVPNSGIMGFDWGHSSLPPISFKFGVMARWMQNVDGRVFGSWVMRRRVIDEVGLFYEGYGPYGMEDSCMNIRVNLAGFNSFYHPTMTSQHKVHDVGEDTPYRRMKDESLKKNSIIFEERVKHFLTQGIREPLPQKRDPI